jgi:S1-C subfamily serine protease
VGCTALGLMVALVTAGVVMATTGTGEQDVSGSTPGGPFLTAAPTTEPGAGQAVGKASIASMVSSIRPSTVVIITERSSGTSLTTGVVVESGGMIVTTSGALTGARAITVIEPGGSREAAELVGIDQPSGIAVLRIGDDLPAATFDGDDPSTGTGAVAMALEPGRGAGALPSPLVYAGTVASAGQALNADPVTTTFAATAVDTPLSRDDVGCPLLDRAGHVSGLLDQTVVDGASTVSVFLPAELVLGVAQQLVASGAVVHGWLGVHTSDAHPTATTAANTPAAPVTTGAVAPSVTTDAGARLDSIDVDSPASLGELAVGDVITAIGGSRVRSSAELQTRLYPDRPGTTLQVAFTRAGVPMTTVVVLAGPDPDAQGSRPSP